MYKYIKRLLDIMISFLGLLITMPILILVAILIKLDSKGPIIFKQDRIGKNGKVFKMYKFRSMTVGAEKGGVYESKNDARVTRVGKVIRKLSIDELPQFVNILKGDMSVIGPRPVLTYHPWKYNEYSTEQLKRFNVRPGVTGYAQVNGRKDVEWNKRIELDIHYVNNLSFWLDTKIFFKTIINVLLMKDNVNKENTVKTNNDNLTLMYITNKPEIASIADKAGVDWIFIDLELKGKVERQGHLDTVISRHSVNDIKPVKKVLKNSKLLVRVDKINEDSENQIKEVIKEGAEIVMLPYFKTKEEVRNFIKYVNKKAETCLLLETVEAAENIDSILELEGIDYIHIGLNDLHLEYKLKFMFELLSNGTVERLVNKIKNKNIPYGFGGIARLGEGDLSADYIIAEHKRLKSSMAILSRAFYNTKASLPLNEIENIFIKGIDDIRSYEKELEHKDQSFFNDNKKNIDIKVSEIMSRR